MKMRVVQASQPAAARMAASQQTRPEFFGQNDPAIQGTMRNSREKAQKEQRTGKMCVFRFFFEPFEPFCG
jgi:hypothetical protein